MSLGNLAFDSFLGRKTHGERQSEREKRIYQDGYNQGYQQKVLDLEPINKDLQDEAAFLEERHARLNLYHQKLRDYSDDLDKENGSIQREYEAMLHKLHARLSQESSTPNRYFGMTERLSELSGSYINFGHELDRLAKGVTDKFLRKVGRNDKVNLPLADKLSLIKPQRQKVLIAMAMATIQFHILNLLKPAIGSYLGERLEKLIQHHENGGKVSKAQLDEIVGETCILVKSITEFSQLDKKSFIINQHKKLLDDGFQISFNLDRKLVVDLKSKQPIQSNDEKQLKITDFLDCEGNDVKLEGDLSVMGLFR